MYAIFENGGKQYKVCVGDLLKVEKINKNVGESVNFPVVLVADDKGIQVGKEVAGLNVVAEVLAHGKDKKIIVFKYKPKKNERKKQGHRQPFTQIKVTAIGEAADEKPAAKKPAAKKPAATKKPVEDAVATETAATKAPAAKTTAAKKPAAKKPAAEATATEATAAKKPAAKKTAAKKPAAETKAE